MEMIIAPNADRVARIAASIIRCFVVAKPNCVLGLSTGSSPLRAYDPGKHQNPRFAGCGAGRYLGSMEGHALSCPGVGADCGQGHDGACPSKATLKLVGSTRTRAVPGVERGGTCRFWNIKYLTFNVKH